MSLVAACIEMIAIERVKRNWKWGTMKTRAYQLAGASKRLPSYAPGFPTIRLSCFAEWQDFTKLLELKCAEKEQSAPAAATVEEINAAVERLRAQGEFSEAVFIALAWHVCGRFGDVSQLKRSDVDWKDNGQIFVTFHRGKSVRLQRQAYTVYSKMDREHYAWMREWLDARPAAEFLWPQPRYADRLKWTQTVRDKLRETNGALECRSVRRGALQTLAESGVSEAVLLLFSRHKSVTTLRRYLNYGKKNVSEAARCAEAAAALSGGGGDTPFGDNGLLERLKFGIAPSYAQLGLKDTTGRTWRCHVKNVTKGDLDVVDSMAEETPTEEYRSNWTTSRPWIKEDETYASIDVGSPFAIAGDFVLASAWGEIVEEADLTQAEVDEMLAANHVAEIFAEDFRKIKGTARLFTVKEPRKKRRRIIKHTFAINAMFGKETCRRVRFPHTRALWNAVFRGKYALSFDFAAFFDAIALTEEISYRHCFRVGDRYFRLLTLPMGQRQAVEVAQAITDIARDVGVEAVFSDSCIDNVRFISDDRRKLLEAGRRFVARCKAMNLTLNDVNDDTDIEDLITSEHEYLGVVFDYMAKTVCVGEKTLDKIRLVMEHRDDWTYRNYCALMGLLFFASPILRLDMSKFFRAISAYRHIARQLQDDHRLWDKPIGEALWPSSMPNLEEWIAHGRVLAPGLGN
jgi:integrase